MLFYFSASFFLNRFSFNPLNLSIFAAPVAAQSSRLGNFFLIRIFFFSHDFFFFYLFFFSFILSSAVFNFFFHFKFPNQIIALFFLIAAIFALPSKLHFWSTFQYLWRGDGLKMPSLSFHFEYLIRKRLSLTKSSSI